MKGTDEMDNKKPIYAVVILKDENYVQSHTFACLKEIKGIRAIFCDNSKNNYANFMVEHFAGFKYLPVDSDRDTAYAIHKAAEYIAAQDDDAFICVFDKQTHIEPDYFERLSKKLEDRAIYFPALSENGSPIPMRKVINGLADGFTLSLETAKEVFTNDITIDKANEKLIGLINDGKIKSVKLSDLTIDRRNGKLTEEQIEWNRRFSW